MSHLVIIAGTFSLGLIAGLTYAVAVVARHVLNGNFEPPDFSP